MVSVLFVILGFQFEKSREENGFQDYGRLDTLSRRQSDKDEL